MTALTSPCPYMGLLVLSRMALNRKESEMATEADLKQMSMALATEIRALCLRKFNGKSEDDVSVIANALMNSLASLCAATDVEPQALVGMFLKVMKVAYDQAGHYKVECGMVDARNPMADVNSYGPAFGTKPSKYEVN